MEVDKAGSDTQARAIAKKKKDAEIEEQNARLELARVQRERDKAISAEREKGERQMVEISAAAGAQMDSLKKLNSERVHALNENSNKHYEDLSKRTAEELKRADASAFDVIEAKKISSMEKIKQVTSRSEDPFYQLKSLSPALSESDREYTVKVSLPEHEAKNLYVTGEGQYVKLSLARRFQENAKNQETHQQTKTSSYQSVVEQIPIPGAFDGRKISRDYKDGVVTITVPKTDFTPKDGVKKA